MLSLYAILAAAAGGTICLGFAEPETRPAERLAGGVAVGAALFGLVALVLASFFGLTPLVVFASATLVAGVPMATARFVRVDAGPRPPACTPLRGVKRKDPGQVQGRGAPPSAALVAYFAVFLVFLGVFFAKAAYERDGAMMTGEWNNLGDLAFHVAIVEGFAQGENLPPEHPEFAGARLTYPFLCDFIAAALVVGGLPLLSALYVQNLVLGFAMLVLLYRWAFALMRDRLAAMLLPVVVLFCGGLGVYTFVWESRATGRPLLDFFLKPPHAVTILWDQYGDVLRWGNALTAFFLPQRAWLVGLPLALLVWTWWWQALPLADDAERRRKLLAAGLVAGLLPLAHTHSFLVMMAMGAALALLHHRRWREWVVFFGAALAVALPQILWITRGAQAQAGSFLAWHYGWARPENTSMSLLTFWLVNTGLTLPLAAAAFLWRGQARLVPARLTFFLLPFAFCLVVPNFIKLSPWEWDTNKVLFYGYLALVVPISLLLARLLRGPSWMKALGVLALALLTISGAVDVWRVVSGSQEWAQFDADTVAQARLIEQKTPPRARILSAFGSGRPTLLTGRRSLVGHPWTMWSHGLAAEARLADMRRIFAGEPDADALLRQYAIDYVLVGPAERSELSPNEAYFGRFETVGEAGGARLYRVGR